MCLHHAGCMPGLCFRLVLIRQPVCGQLLRTRFVCVCCGGTRSGYIQGSMYGFVWMRGLCSHGARRQQLSREEVNSRAFVAISAISRFQSLCARVRFFDAVCARVVFSSVPFVSCSSPCWQRSPLIPSCRCKQKRSVGRAPCLYVGPS